MICRKSRSSALVNECLHTWPLAPFGRDAAHRRCVGEADIQEVALTDPDL
jgi:hypothetical protein